MQPQSGTLTDVQSSLDERGIAIQKVGVKDVEVPLNVMQKNGSIQQVVAQVTLTTTLSQDAKGSHLSRFLIQLTEHSYKKAFCFNLKNFLEDTRKRLNSISSYIKINFRYFIDKESPVTGITAPMAYSCHFEATLNEKSDYQFIIGVEVPVSTLCPCSKAIAKHGAHNQRALIRAKVMLDTQHDYQLLWIEDLVKSLEKSASCPVYPVLKREDEKYVTEHAYENPKFVEDVVRDAIQELRSIPAILGFEVSVEAFESIHAHNAWAFHQEGLNNFGAVSA